MGWWQSYEKGYGERSFVWCFAHATGINLQGRIGLQDVFSIDGGPTYGLIKEHINLLLLKTPNLLSMLFPLNLDR